MRTLWLYQTPSIAVGRRGGIITGNYKRQAQVLCALLVSAAPSGTVQEFCQLIGGDYEKLVGIGNTYLKEHPFPSKRKGRRPIGDTLDEEVVNNIKVSQMSRKEIAELHNLPIQVVERIRRS